MYVGMCVSVLMSVCTRVGVCMCGVPIVQKLHKRTLETDRLNFKPHSTTC